jgi:hypothetical protein
VNVEVVACAGVAILSKLGSMQVSCELLSDAADGEGVTGSEGGIGVDETMSVDDNDARTGVCGGEFSAMGEYA